MADEILGLANRIEKTPSYSGHHLRASVRQVGSPRNTARHDKEVILIEAKWRAVLVEALRAHVSAVGDSK